MKWFKWLRRPKRGRPHSGTGTQSVLDSGPHDGKVSGNSHAMYEEPEEKLKLIAVGDGGCGKTCLLTVFTKGTFLESHIPTVFEIETITMEVGARKMTLQLWDTAGQEDYDRLRPLFYPDTDVALMCYAIDSQSTLQNIAEKWAPEVRHFCPQAQLILVGNKKDLREAAAQTQLTPSERPVTYEEGLEMALTIRAAHFIECSALRNQGIDEVFSAAVKSVLAKDEKLHSRCVIL